MCTIRRVLGGYLVRLRPDIPPVFVSDRGVAVTMIENNWFTVCIR